MITGLLFCSCNYIIMIVLINIYLIFMFRLFKLMFNYIESLIIFSYF